MRGLVFGVILAFAMSGAALARQGGEGNDRGHESEHSRGEHHRHQLHDEHSQRMIILSGRQMDYGLLILTTG